MINSTNSDLSVTHDNELAYILSKFNSDFIYTTVTESIKGRLRNYNMPLPNIVISFEQAFKATLENYPAASDSIWAVRDEVYTQIIKLLCDNYQLVFDDNDSYDKYTSAMYMYSLLVSDFQSNLIAFFANYIIKEKSSIYSMLELSDARKKKDSSTIYAKKIFKNPKLGVISANLENVLSSISNSFDIDFATYLDFVFIGSNRAISKHLQEVVSPTNDFVKEYIGMCFNTEFRPILITSIRLALQQYTIDNDLNQNNIIKEEE